MLYCGQMDTDLMRSPGIQPAANPCEIHEVLLYKHIGSGTLAMLGYAHLSRIVSISGDSPGDGAVLLCNVSPSKCLILPIDLLIFQHGIKQWLQKGNFAEYHGSAGFVIQAVKRANTGIVSLQKIMCLDQITDGVCTVSYTHLERCLELWEQLSVDDIIANGVNLDMDIELLMSQKGKYKTLLKSYVKNRGDRKSVV